MSSDKEKAFKAMLGQVLPDMLEQHVRDTNMERVIKRLKKFLEYFEERNSTDRLILSVLGQITHSADILLKHADFESEDGLEKKDACAIMLRVLDKAREDIESVMKELTEEEEAA